jgi:hypothetical protein
MPFDPILHFINQRGRIKRKPKVFFGGRIKRKPKVFFGGRIKRKPKVSFRI